MKTSIAVAVAVGLAATVTTRAATITQQIQFGPGAPDFNSATGTDTQGGNGGSGFYYFATSSLNTLNSITFSSTYAFSSTITLTNTSQNSASGSARTESGAMFSGSTSAITTALNRAVNTNTDGNLTLTPVAYDILGSNNTYNLTAGSSQSFTSPGQGTTGPITDTNASDLAAFSSVGAGTYNILFSTETHLAIRSTSGNVSPSQMAQAMGTVTITYNYTPAAAPEPATWILIGVGAVGAGVIALRQRRVVV